jgi:hypothetical protein
MDDRRLTRRRPVTLLFNKYLEGRPYLCRSIDISAGGMLAATHVEPERQPDSFAVEVCFPGQTQSTWLWARTVRRCEDRQAIEFLGVGAGERAWLERQIPVAAC